MSQRSDDKVYRDRLGVDIEISMYYRMRDVEQALSVELDRFIKEANEEYVVFPAKESIRLAYREPNYGTMTERYRFVWHPSTEKGVEFVGGPVDGTIAAVPMLDGWARPLWLVVVAPPADVAGMIDESATCPVSGIGEARYVRDGIDRLRDRWVYTYAGDAR